MRPAKSRNRPRRAPKTRTRRLWTVLTACACAALTYAVPTTDAAAKPNVKRTGGQAELTFGGSLCIPGVASCSSSIDVVGKTGPSIGAGFTIGYRPHRAFLIGAAYNVGFFNPDYRLGDTDPVDLYSVAYQQGVYGVLRGILPLWRIDLGLELAPGWSRQAFKVAGDGYTTQLEGSTEVVTVTKEYSQGFSLKTAPVVDIYITRQLFIGAKLDFIWNFHGQVCYKYSDGGTTTCFGRQETNQASVHQLIVGLHIGGTF